MNNEIIKFVNGDLQLDVTVSPNEETVWLTQKQTAELFDVKSQAITRHLKNIYNDEELFHLNLFQNGTSCPLTINGRSKLRFKSRCIPALSIIPQQCLHCMVSQKNAETGPPAPSPFVSTLCNTALPTAQGFVTFPI